MEGSDIKEILRGGVVEAVVGLFNTRINADKTEKSEADLPSKIEYFRKMASCENVIQLAKKARKDQDNAIAAHEKLRILLESKRYLDP